MELRPQFSQSKGSVPVESTVALSACSGKAAAGLGNSVNQLLNFLMRGGFGGGMHAMLRDFVDTSRGRLLAETEELIQGSGAFTDLVGLL